MFSWSSSSEVTVSAVPGWSAAIDAKIMKLLLCHYVYNGFCLNFKLDLPFQNTIVLLRRKSKFSSIFFVQMEIVVNTEAELQLSGFF